MSTDLTHFLAPTSRMATDMRFLVRGGAELPAHKSILATALEAFDTMFYKAATARDSVEVEDVGLEAFQLFLHHVYGR